ncbi:MAG TPA: lactonase family protein [Chloroflexota bacterium]|nr:lactonase family protein [Chloroflexota bacterium]
MPTFVYVGTFTGGLLGGEPAEGIYVYEMEPSSGALTHVQTVGGLSSPSYLALHPTLPMLFTVEREWSPEETNVGALTAFRIDPGSGKLTLAGRERSGGDYPAHVSVHPSGRFAFTANPRDWRVAALPLNDEGLPEPASSIMRHGGRGPKARQPAPYPHSSWPDHTGKWLLACDLGIDRVMIYRFDEVTGQLEPADFPYAQVSSGAGARHLAFHPNNRVVYVLNELDATLSVFSFDPETGILDTLQTVDNLPPDYDGRRSGAHVLVHPSGRFVYASSRGHDSLAVYAVTEATGRPRFLEHVSTQGRTPRNFNLSPNAGLMLVANQHGSGSVVSFRVEDGGARLVPTGASTTMPSPVCVVFYQVGSRQ